MASENSRRINQPNLCPCAQMWLIDFEAQLPITKAKLALQCIAYTHAFTDSISIFYHFA